MQIVIMIKLFPRVPVGFEHTWLCGSVVVCGGGRGAGKGADEEAKPGP